MLNDLRLLCARATYWNYGDRFTASPRRGGAGTLLDVGHNWH
jgi:hypothetical protein